MKAKAIFLDRDGVLNQAVVKNGKPFPPPSLDELFIPGDVFSSLTALKAMGFLLIGATNQPDVARGVTLRSTVESINQALLAQLPLDEIRVCYHDDRDNCYCRKPLPGLLLEAADDFAIDLKQSIMIGDRWKDIEAGKRAGCKTIWIDYCYQEVAPSAPDFAAKSLQEAYEWISNYTN